MWVHVGFERENFEEDRVKREVSMKKSFKDPTDSQIKDAHMKVAGFVPGQNASQSHLNLLCLNNFAANWFWESSFSSSLWFLRIFVKFVLVVGIQYVFSMAALTQLWA